MRELEREQEVFKNNLALCQTFYSKKMQANNAKCYRITILGMGLYMLSLVFFL